MISFFISTNFELKVRFLLQCVTFSLHIDNQPNLSLRTKLPVLYLIVSSDIHRNVKLENICLMIYERDFSSRLIIACTDCMKHIPCTVSIAIY